MSEPIALDAASIEAISRRVVELMRAGAPPAGLIDAAEVARRLGLARSTVYDSPERYGGIKVGSRWRFDPAAIDRPAPSADPSAQPETTPAPARRTGRSRRRRIVTRAGSPLLPVKDGREAA